MAEEFYPFDAGAGDVVTESEWAKVARLWRPTGVVAGEDDELEVSADGTDMTVDVAAGVAWVRGFYYRSDAVQTLSIAAADPFEARIDRVVVELDRAGNVISVVVLQGTPDADPASAMATLTQDDVTWHVERARVTVPANATSIAAGNVDNVGDLVVDPTFAAGGDNPDEADGRAWVRVAGGAYVPTDVVTEAEHTTAAHDALGIDAATLDGLDSIAFLRHSLADAAGDLLVATAADAFDRLAKGADGTVLGVAGGAVGWITPTTGGAVEVGSYTGNNTNDRTIPLGFTPALVMLYGPNLVAWSPLPGAGTLGFRSGGGSTSLTTDDHARPRLTTNGFLVSWGGFSGTINFSGDVFYYIAWPEP